MKRVGAHVSAAGGVQNAPLNAAKIGAEAFALFVKNQRQWNAKPLSEENVREFKANLAAANIDPRFVLPHSGYLINIGHPNAVARAKSVESLLDEVKRCDALGLDKLNFHPGSHLNEIEPSECLVNIAEAMNYIIRHSENVRLVLENTAGQGSNMGFKFEHLARIIELCEDQSRVGVCLDTCHLFAAGYDISTKECYEWVMEEFSRLVGFEFLAGMHINESMFECGKKKDRHERLGHGKIGSEAFGLIMKDERIDEIPLVLETIDETLWADEIALLKSLRV